MKGDIKIPKDTPIATNICLNIGFYIYSHTQWAFLFRCVTNLLTMADWSIGQELHTQSKGHSMVGRSIFDQIFVKEYDLPAAEKLVLNLLFCWYLCSNWLICVIR